ncbi:MAG TPA: hypothetical protein VMU95_25930 [Trebonia sp.]|nr:hypothetical protein [Trebonia sp.]
MTRVPGDPQALTEIESQLARSDPALAAMFAVFAADPARARSSVQKVQGRPPPPFEEERARSIRVAVLVGLSIVVMVCTTMAIITAP